MISVTMTSVDEHRDDADRLVDHLHRIAFEQAGGAAVLVDREHAGEQRAGGAADSVHPERVERVVIAEHVLEAGAAPVADDAGRDADPERAHRTDEARRRRDGHQTGHRARADAITVGLPLRIHSTIIQVKPAVAVAVWVTSMAMPACRPALVAEPALKPNQPTHSSEAPIRVSIMLWAGPVSLRFAQHQRAHQAGQCPN